MTYEYSSGQKDRFFKFNLVRIMCKRTGITISIFLLGTHGIIFSNATVQYPVSQISVINSAVEAFKFFSFRNV